MPKTFFNSVLVLAGIESFFFLVAGVVLFWIQDENYVDNISMFLTVDRQSRTFQLLMLPGAQKAGRRHSWDCWPKLAKEDVPHHMRSCFSIQTREVDWRAATAAWGGTGYCSSSGEQLHCISLVLYVLLLLQWSLPLLSH